MAILKLQLDKPVEACLKYAKGKFYDSKFPGQDGQLMYSLTSGKCVFLPDTMDETFASKNIGADVPFVICMRKTRAGAKFYQVERLSDAAEPETPFDPPSKLESMLAASLAHEQQRKAAVTPSKSSLPPVAATEAPISQAPQQINPIAIVPAPERPRAGSLMASAMVAAVDACIIAQEYAQSKGLALAFGHEDIRAIAATLYIQHSKDPQYAQRAGGRQ
jgi:hypothetical protein